MPSPIDTPRSFTDSLRGVLADASSSVDGLVNEDHIRLAVTGLSRAGKTVFITSLIQNLLALGRGRNTLPQLAQRLTSQGVSRLRSVTILPPGAALLPHFDHAAKLAELAADAPSWPSPTVDLAQVSLAIEVKRKSSVGHPRGHMHHQTGRTIHRRGRE